MRWGTQEAWQLWEGKLVSCGWVMLELVLAGHPAQEHRQAGEHDDHLARRPREAGRRGAAREWEFVRPEPGVGEGMKSWTMGAGGRERCVHQTRRDAR